MSVNETALFPGPVLAEKAARPPEEKAKKTTNECLPRMRKRRGGQPGNTNALRHGRRSAAYREARRALRARLRELRALRKWGKALKIDSETEARILAALEQHAADLMRLQP